MITYIERGNIFEIDGVNNYAHGCNCVGAMGKGIALQFRYKFPNMYLQYKKLCAEKRFNLGDSFEYNYGEGYVFNLGTQSSWRTKAEIGAIQTSLKKMLSFCSRAGITRIALPAIGAGLGGLKWEEVKKIIETESKDYEDVHLFVVENYG